MTGRSRPFWIIGGYSAVAALIFLAQLLPRTGIFLMVVGGGLWIAALLNIMLIHLVFEAATRAISLKWLLLPGILYGAWGVFAIAQSVEASRVINHLEAENRVTVAVPRDAPLIFENGDELAVAAKKFIVGSNVYAGDFQLIVEKAEDRRGGCRKDLIDRQKGERFLGSFNAVPGFDEKVGCVYAKAAPRPMHGLYFRKQVPNARMQTAYSLELIGEDGKAESAGHFAYGLVRWVSAKPLFYAGCTLISSSASWNCGFALPTRFIGFGGEKALLTDRRNKEAVAQTLAGLLGLPVRHWSER